MKQEQGKYSINFSQFIKNRIANIGSIDSFVFAFAVGIGPWVVPTSGAAIFAYSLHEWAPENMGDLRLYVAIAAGLGLIIAGAVSSDNAIAAGTPEAWRLVYGYIILEITGLWFMTVGWDVKVVGTVMALTTLIVYLAKSSTKKAGIAKAETKEADQIKMGYQLEQARLNAEHQRAMAAQAAELKHAEKLARIEAQAFRQPSGNLPATAGGGEALPEWLPELPKDAAHFRQLVGNGSATVPADLSGAELGRIIGKSSRTGQNWLAAARNGK